jgi:O-antigen/teichoic acid export membrane protein
LRAERELGNAWFDQDLAPRLRAATGRHQTAGLFSEPRDAPAGIALPATRLSSLRSTAADAIFKVSPFGYGFVAQACSAATNFGLLVIAAHVLGVAGLGTISLGFAAYILLLGFERALLTDPLIASSAAQGRLERATTARSALTVALVALVPASILLALVATLLPPRFGLGILLFSPWIGPALLQDLGRSILFRDRSGPSVMLSDGAWLLAMAATAPIAFTSESEWAVTGCWGAGALAAAGVATWQIRWRPGSPRRAFAWWRSEAWPFGRWLLGGSALYSVLSYASLLALVAVLGAREFGGLRAVQSVFGPLTLIGPAVALSGFPLVSRLLAVSRSRALAVAAALGGAITLVTAAYLVTLYVSPNVLALVFGREFDEFQSIIVPIGIGQLLIAPALGLTLFLKAQRRGRTLLWLTTLNAVLLLVLSVIFGWYRGVAGAAWATVATAAVGGMALAVALRQTLRNP